MGHSLQSLVFSQSIIKSCEEGRGGECQHLCWVTTKDSSALMVLPLEAWPGPGWEAGGHSHLLNSHHLPKFLSRQAGVWVAHLAQRGL